jgi:flagella basal body P-ring formation protein FlgA
MMKTTIVALVLIAACGSATGAPASPIENLETIRTAVGEFVRNQLADSDETLSIEVGRLDPRLRLHQCGGALATYFSPGTRPIGNVTVGVRCNGPKSWALYVPVHIDRQVEIVVAKRPIMRGAIIGQDDLTSERRSVTAIRGNYFSDPEDVIGMAASRSLRPGAPLTHSIVKAARVVRRGERVILTLRGERIAVKMAGTALRDGTRGQVIPVRNLSSNRIVEGVVSDPGLVVVRGSAVRP